MTTAVLPLTEDEEREFRQCWTGRPTWAHNRIDRLLATLDAERARRAPEPLACDVCGNASDDVPVEVCRHCYDLARSPMAAPPHSRSEAKRLAAQRGEPAPVFDANDWAVGDIAAFDHRKTMLVGRVIGVDAGALDVLAMNWAQVGSWEQLRARPGPPYAALPSSNWRVAKTDCRKLVESAPPYPASVVEAVRALDRIAQWADGIVVRPDFDCPAHASQARDALASLPKDLRDAARAPR